MHSQSNEDTILEALIAKYGAPGKRFVEFGCGKGNQNNTINLLLKGWSGLWFEIRKKNYRSACRLWEGYPVTIRRYRVIPEKVNLVVKDPLDLLSIDIDGNDHAVWEACNARPRLVVIEYDAVNGTDLDTMKALGRRKGYVPTETSSNGVNVFFVREDLLREENTRRK